MDTDRLIGSLAADNEFRESRVSAALAPALMIGGLVALAMVMATMGFRHDFMGAMRNPFFDLKFVVTLSLALPAIAMSLHLSRPDASLKGVMWWLLLPVAILALAIPGEMMMRPQRAPMMTRLVGTNAVLCLTVIPLLSLPLLAAALVALRHGAPARPAVAGAVAGLMSAGIAATLYAAHCIDDSPLFVATWYTLATALVTAIGALAGSKFLRY